MENINIEEDIETLMLNIKGAMVSSLDLCNSLDDVELIESKYISDKDSILKTVLQKLRSFDHEEKKRYGKLINDNKNYFLGLLFDKKSSLKRKEVFEKEKSEFVDLEICGKSVNFGGKTFVQDLQDKITHAFVKKGFVCFDANEVDTDDNNFLLLNFPKDHPARNMQDTFYVDKLDRHGRNLLLRTHTSNAQPVVIQHLNDANLLNQIIHDDKNLGIISSGKCFRNEDISCRSHVFFNQIEIFNVGTNLTLSDLFGAIEYLIETIFDFKVKYRCRSSYFPFVQPGFEVDISCLFCSGSSTGCSICKYTGWLEILGCGMIHHNIFTKNIKNAPTNLNSLTGYAIGLGLERIVMLLNNIDDIRDLHSGKFSILRNRVL